MVYKYNKDVVWGRFYAWVAWAAFSCIESRYCCCDLECLLWHCGVGWVKKQKVGCRPGTSNICDFEQSSYIQKHLSSSPQVSPYWSCPLSNSHSPPFRQVVREECPKEIAGLLYSQFLTLTVDFKIFLFFVLFLVFKSWYKTDCKWTCMCAQPAWQGMWGWTRSGREIAKAAANWNTWDEHSSKV